MLSQLFESSKVLDDVSLHHLVDALCRLSTEDMETATNNKVFNAFWLFFFYKCLLRNECLKSLPKRVPDKKVEQHFS